MKCSGTKPAHSSRILLYIVTIALWASVPGQPVSYACGGFFCQQVSIDQAGERIIFRQDGNIITVIVQIQYTGDAEDFSWVLPVPGLPKFEPASDLIFGPLEQATRPQFRLDVEGRACPDPFEDDAADDDPTVEEEAGQAAPGGGVGILLTTSVGPFDLQLVTSDDPAAMAQWLDDNGYDLSDRGQELLTPYVEAGFNFVVLKLAQDQGVGDLQPLKLTYQASSPMIPLRLTAVAATPDMGVLVWILGHARAVPINYPHVEVNYTKLNWYRGSFAAYADYQNLVTAAMNETGKGQGFVTDYAGTDLDVSSQLPDPDLLRFELSRLGNLSDVGQFYLDLLNNAFFAQDKVLAILRRELPLPPGQDEVVYFIPSLLAEAVSVQFMSGARTRILLALIDSVILPLENSRTLFDGMPYMTRLFTTLSPEEMTVDPVFDFNPDLPDQPLQRRATLRYTCQNPDHQWELVLGQGTGRDGEMVICGNGDPLGFGAPLPEVGQSAIGRSLRMTTTGPGEMITDYEFDVVHIDFPRTLPPVSSGSSSRSGGALCGTGLALLPLLLVLPCLRKRY